MDARTQLHESPAAPASAESALCAAHQAALQPPLPPAGLYGAPYYASRQPQNQRGLIVAVVAAIVVAGALIAGAVLLKGGGGQPQAPTTPVLGQQSTVASEPSGTCAAWETAKADFKSITTLPAGWTYSTPGIDALISARVAQVDKTLSVFEGQIEAGPAAVAAAAHLFVEKQAVEVEKLPQHSFDAADVSAIEGAYAALNRACGA
ncbi:hypothetical protein ACNQR7_31720 [Mycolicibacterium senegalense]|uniref:hypothetical protein n=1 Tax=Mycolicibacterium senegalense TaxID=1796 RepID=UPI003AADC7C2